MEPLIFFLLSPFHILWYCLCWEHFCWHASDDSNIKCILGGSFSSYDTNREHNNPLVASVLWWCILWYTVVMYTYVLGMSCMLGLPCVTYTSGQFLMHSTNIYQGSIFYTPPKSLCFIYFFSNGYRLLFILFIFFSKMSIVMRSCFSGIVSNVHNV